MLPPRPSLAGHLVPRWPSLAGHLVILWLLQSVTVLGYRSSDPEHITAILGQTVMYSAANRLICEVVQARRRPLLGPSPD